MMFKVALLSLYFLQASLVESKAADHSLVQSKAANLPLALMTPNISMGLWKKDGPVLQSLDMGRNKNHSVIYGERKGGDSLLFKETIVKGRNSLGGHNSFFSKVDFPLNGETNDKIINYISLVDNKADGEGGYAIGDLNGGVGSKTARLYFWAICYGFNYTAEIYGI